MRSRSVHDCCVLEDRALKQVIGFANELTNPLMKAEAARAIVYSGNGSVCLERVKKRRVATLKQVVMGAFLLGTTALAGCFYQQSHNLQAERTSLRQTVWNYQIQERQCERDRQKTREHYTRLESKARQYDQFLANIQTELKQAQQYGQNLQTDLTKAKRQASTRCAD